ncbi:hypothetical protein KBI52_05485 [Microvirga sp. HBU67558]|uniref:hypothetical protein n=1 Tax=Microvirga TaxID=186650 RepID=UPI001B3854B7|nr:MULTISPECIES: hypothetical protein [unclassified Microvirga]MBQ0819671.1 hypothetical protein [Microvirga sp. HBU67558]
MLKDYGKPGFQNERFLLVMMLLELNEDQLSILRRALEARVRDMHLRLGSDPGDEGFRREATLSTQLLRQVEALERQAGHRAWRIGQIESLPEEDED